MQVVGSVVIGVGLLMILVGVVMAWREYRINRQLGPTDFVNALKDLVIALANTRPSLALFAFGTLLVFLGGIMAGVAGFTS
jgi:hypothetical protein